MKILWLSHVIPYPPKGGLWQRSYNLLKQIAKNNEVHLVSLNQKRLFSTPESIREARLELKKICDRIDVFPIRSDASIWNWATMTVVSYFRNTPYDINWLYNKEMLLFMKKLANNDRYDVIHVDTLGVFPYAEPFSGIPVVLNHHNIESDMMSLRYKKEENSLKKIYFKRETRKILDYERDICPRCSMNLVVSDLDALRLKKNTGDVEITVIPNGVDVEYFKPNNKTNHGERGLLFAGGMRYYANREAVLFFVSEIWPLLKKDNLNRPITFIGRNPPKELLDVTSNSTISAPGFVDDVRPYFDAASIYICPIKNGGGTRLKILDALAMKKPLISTEFAVEGLGLIEGEHYIRAETAVEFVNQITRLENDASLRQKLADAGRRFVEDKYSWEIIGRKMQKTYYNIANLHHNQAMGSYSGRRGI